MSSMSAVTVCHQPKEMPSRHYVVPTHRRASVTPMSSGLTDLSFQSQQGRVLPTRTMSVATTSTKPRVMPESGRKMSMLSGMYYPSTQGLLTEASRTTTGGMSHMLRSSPTTLGLSTSVGSLTYFAKHRAPAKSASLENKLPMESTRFVPPVGGTTTTTTTMKKPMDTHKVLKPMVPHMMLSKPMSPTEDGMIIKADTFRQMVPYGTSSSSPQTQPLQQSQPLHQATTFTSPQRITKFPSTTSPLGDEKRVTKSVVSYGSETKPGSYRFTTSTSGVAATHPVPARPIATRSQSSVAYASQPFTRTVSTTVPAHATKPLTTTTLTQVGKTCMPKMTETKTMGTEPYSSAGKSTCVYVPTRQYPSSLILRSLQDTTSATPDTSPMTLYIQTDKLQQLESSLCMLKEQLTPLLSHKIATKAPIDSLSSTLSPSEMECLKGLLTSTAEKSTVDKVHECVTHILQQLDTVTIRTEYSKPVEFTTSTMPPATQQKTSMLIRSAKPDVMDKEQTGPVAITEPTLAKPYSLEPLHELQQDRQTMPKTSLSTTPYTSLEDIQKYNSMALKKTTQQPTKLDDSKHQQLLQLRQEYLYSLQVETAYDGKTVTRCIDVIKIYKAPTILLMTEFLTLTECQEVQHIQSEPHMIFDLSSASLSESDGENILDISRRRLAAILKMDAEDVESLKLVKRSPYETSYELSTAYGAATVVIFLNDVISGGALEFQSLGLHITPRAGTAVVWMNSFEEMKRLHATIVPSSSPLSILVCDITGSAVLESESTFESKSPETVTSAADEFKINARRSIKLPKTMRRKRIPEDGKISKLEPVLEEEVTFTQK